MVEQFNVTPAALKTVSTEDFIKINGEINNVENRCPLSNQYYRCNY